MQRALFPSLFHAASTPTPAPFTGTDNDNQRSEGGGIHVFWGSSEAAGFWHWLTASASFGFMAAPRGRIWKWNADECTSVDVLVQCCCWYFFTLQGTWPKPEGVLFALEFSFLKSVAQHYMFIMFFAGSHWYTMRQRFPDKASLGRGGGVCVRTYAGLCVCLWNVEWPRVFVWSLLLLLIFFTLPDTLLKLQGILFLLKFSSSFYKV